MRKESSGPVGVEVGSFTVLLRVASTSREHFMIVAFMQPATSTSQGTESSLIVRDSACIRCVARSMATDKQLPACKRCSQMQDSTCEHCSGRLPETVRSVASAPLRDSGCEEGGVRSRRGLCHCRHGNVYTGNAEPSEQSSCDAGEVWLQMDIPDFSAPGRCQWAEVGLGTSGLLYAEVGMSKECLDAVCLSMDQLRKCKSPLVCTMIDHRPGGGWIAKVEVMSLSSLCKAITVSLQPSPSHSLVVKRIVVHLHGNTATPGKIELVQGDEGQIVPPHSPSLPSDLHTGPQLERGSDYIDFSVGRRTNYLSRAENGCLLHLKQEASVRVLSRSCASQSGKWENVFATVVKVTNRSEEKITIKEVYGEYLNDGNEWVKCDDILITKSFFPSMYKWCVSKRYVNLAPGFSDSLAVQLSISFDGSMPIPGWAHPSLPQPLHLRITFRSVDGLAASLHFEQGNPLDVLSRESREEEWGELLGYLFVDDANCHRRMDTAMSFDSVSGELQLCYAVSGRPSLSPLALWPLVHKAAFEANQSGYKERILEVCPHHGDSCCGVECPLQVSALIHPETSTAHTLKITMKTSSSVATGYWELPYTDPAKAVFSLRPKLVKSSQCFSVEWNVPRACKSDSIAIYSHRANCPYSEGKNFLGLPSGTVELKAPHNPGCYDVRYVSEILSRQWPGRFKRYWKVGTILVTAASL